MGGMEGIDAGPPWWFVALFVALIALFVLALITAVVKGSRQWASNQRQPVRTIRATMVTKRGQGRGSGEQRSTQYFATFELPDGVRLELPVSGSQFGQLAEGDRGMLTHQGTRFKGFVRELPEVPQ